MDRVYDKGGGYTEEAIKIDREVREAMNSLICRELEVGTPIEVLEYAICSAIRTEILKESIRLRVDKITKK